MQAETPPASGIRLRRFQYKMKMIAHQAATPQTSSVYPLHPSANGRYMLDASNAPFLIIDDAPHSFSQSRLALGVVGT
jgi:hypothetical protein